MAKDYSPFQRKVIQRYYNNLDTIRAQKLSELVTEIYLASPGKRLEKLWERAEKFLIPADATPDQRDVLTDVVRARDVEALAAIANQRFDA